MSHHLEPERSLRCSQETATGPCPEPSESSPQTHTLISLWRILLVYAPLSQYVPSGMHLSYATCVLHVPSMITLIISTEEYNLRIFLLCNFSSFMPLTLSKVQIFSEPRSQTTLIFSFHLQWQTKLHPHIEQYINLYSGTF